MPQQHEQHHNLQIFGHPLIQQKLARIRDVNTSTAEFRMLLNQIAALMTFQVSRDFQTRQIEISTPLETTTGAALARPVTLVPILRAGIGMTDGILSLMPEARVGHVGVYRDESSLEPVAYYAKFPPDMADGPVLLVDPMLATGGSAVHAVGVLKERGCTDIRFICLVCAPEGVERMREHHPDIRIYTAALDRQLDEKGYILPGLGDAGDRIFGTL
ncbi:MAG: uracil phosphoribosyltransferase [Planctomycetota bacterium]|jgi:uracil phosphoribosyltransferase